MLSVQYWHPRFFDRAYKNWRLIQVAAIPLIVIGLVAVCALVYATGGIKYVYSHSMYLVVLAAAFAFGAYGGVFVAIIAGIVLGPFMPLDSTTGEAQGTLNWIYRMGFFTAAGLFVGLASDSIKKYIIHLRNILARDPASGLYTRQSLIEKLQNIHDSAEPGKYTFLAVLSLDNASEVEAAYGSEVTDHIISELADRLSNITRPDVLYYRANNRQLAILIPDFNDSNIQLLLNEIVYKSSDPVSYHDIKLHADVRLGYTELDKYDGSAEHLLRKAELALEGAYGRSQRVLRFHADMESSSIKENISLLGQLKSALIENQLSLHYQPKVRISSGKIEGVEALMRWRHPVLGNVPPSKFIPRAEQSTLIQGLTDWALETAIMQLVSWQKQGIHLTMAVNVSTQNLLEPDFVDRVMRLLIKYRMNPNYLELEVTEGAFMHDLELSVKKLGQLKKAGLRLSIDDFGTGYSSLQYLNYLPVSHIKIDRSFIQTLDQTSGSAPIVKAIISVAHELGFEVVAEGVEEICSYQHLEHVNCDTAQGYLIGRPMEIDDFNRWYKINNGEFHADQGKAQGQR